MKNEVLPLVVMVDAAVSPAAVANTEDKQVQFQQHQNGSASDISGSLWSSPQQQKLFGSLHGSLDIKKKRKR